MSIILYKLRVQKIEMKTDSSGVQIPTLRKIDELRGEEYKLEQMINNLKGLFYEIKMETLNKYNK